MFATLSGLNLSTTEPDTGVQWTSKPIDGWGGAASRRVSTPKTRKPGAWSGNGYSDERPIAMSGVVQAPSEAALSEALDRLIDACSFDDTLLTITEPDRSRWCMVHRTGAVLTPRLSPTVAAWSVQVSADDPRKMYAPITASTGLPSSSGGLTVPYVIPYTISAVQTSGQVSIYNAGNETGPVTMRIDGPCVGPVITHVGSGLSLVFAASLTLGAGEWLDIDMEGHSALANGGPTRAQFITSRQWSGLEPGSNTWSFSAASYSPSALLTITATPADK
jgi:hypothetical protein